MFWPPENCSIKVTVLIRYAQGWRRHADGLLGLMHRTREVLKLHLHSWRGGRRVVLLGASEHAAGLLGDCPSPSLVPRLGKQGYAPSASPSHFSPNTATLIVVKAGSGVSGVVVVSPWYIPGYINNARNARGFQEVLDYSVGSAPRVLFLKPCTIFITHSWLHCLCSFAAYL